MLSTRWPTLSVLAAACLLLLFYVSSFRSQISTHRIASRLSGSGRGSVRNETLGFQKVIVLGLKDRPDKHDALTISSSLTGFDITWLEGVKFDDLSPKAVPEAWDFERDPKNTVGCWRAHLNAMQYIVDNHIQSALIMEDDTDWDWFLKDQLETFSQAVSELQAPASSSDSPYGGSWDMLWPGHCRIGPTDDDQDIHFVGNDPTVPPLPFRHSKWRQKHILPATTSNTTRSVFKAYAGMCAYAYALSYEGARKILGSLSLGQDSKVLDVGLSDMCRQTHIKPFDCYGIYPPLFSSHRFAGSRNRDSDIQSHSNAVHPEHTYDVVFSVTQNAQRLLAGEHSVLSQWPNDTVHAELAVDERLALERRVERLQLSNLPVTHVKGINA